VPAGPITNPVTKEKIVKVFVAVPCYDKKVFAPTVQSLMNAMQAMLLMEIPFEFKFEVGCPYVSMARNNLTRAFMASECTDMVFIDADVNFPATAFRDLLNSPEEVIGGAYPKKQDNLEFAVRLKTDADHHPINHNGVLLADSLATGFLKITRSVIEQMQAAYPELEYKDGITGKSTYDFFGTFVKDGRWFGDDYGFCHLWEKLGGEMWCLPNITFGHSGGRSYEGNFQEFLMDGTRKFMDLPEAVKRANCVDGYMTLDELVWLYEQATRMGSVIEIGSWKGRSTTVLLEGCPGTVVAVDNWTGHDPSSNGVLEDHAAKTDVFAEFQVNVGAYANLTVCRGDSKEMSGHLPSVDMVFIDAEHTYEGCKSDIEGYASKAKRLVCGHDYSPAWPGVMQAVNEVFGTRVKTAGSIWYVELF
jgi:hypothetical protein